MIAYAIKSLSGITNPQMTGLMECSKHCVPNHKEICLSQSNIPSVQSGMRGLTHNVFFILFCLWSRNEILQGRMNMRKMALNRLYGPRFHILSSLHKITHFHIVKHTGKKKKEKIIMSKRLQLNRSSI